MPVGSRLRFGFALAAMLALPSCALLPASHYALTTLPFSPDEGWVQLPTARWLVNPGIQPDTLLFCPPDHCGPPSIIARIELSGRETGFADLLIADPVRALSGARPTHQNSKRQPPASRADVTPLSLPGWSGGSVSLEARKGPAKAAHVAVVARRDGQRAVVFMAVSTTSEAAIAGIMRATQ
jgi:hypothetical protein